MNLNTLKISLNLNYKLILNTKIKPKEGKQILENPPRINIGFFWVQITIIPSSSESSINLVWHSKQNILRVVKHANRNFN